MTPPNIPPASERLRRIQSLKESALGLVCTQSFPAIIGTADMMLKSAGVTLIGYEKTGSGFCTAVVRGRIADVRLAVEMGAETAEKFGELVSAVVIPRPLPNLEAVLPIGTRLAELALENSQSRLSNLAVGLLETRGFPAMVGAADAMLKSADVQLAAYETTGAGLCTAIIRGSVADVAIAVEIGMQEAERIGELHAVMVIPRPLDDLEATLPTAACWIEQKPDPLPILLSIPVKEEEKELVELERTEVQPLALPAQAPEPDLLELPDLQKLPKRLEEL
ncbi:BMC domain-containing protein [Trichocoleus sp. FACHB-591]|uniref:BMC domain-containing protein n=2 Tax=Trichocoleusaceae TaxID=2303527 RepID=A0ABV0J141_9CYAN|nr:MULTISPECIES: BMC domain-containing protein [unclassified Trichocoleus]MBD1860117.1 BMC domain-containing protein [Trichocoleus sp. FACHB-46]MBD2094559.1 BMC domain-containing protein [Trichocoleus sp. FACHB-591]MBD2120151.1 BMC domain-containing protein [Trichocoleus sp. FACHB-262]